MQQLTILLLINCSSTCFGRLYAHHQEVRLRFIACGFLPCGSCCDVGELGGKLCAQATHSTHCTQSASQLFNITTATTGQKTIGSETQYNLLMMGVKTPETC
jgi:hypothetical protein